MIYNNLIALLVAIFLLATGSVSGPPQLPWQIALPLFVLKATLLWILAGRLFRQESSDSASRYFSAELRLTIVALLSLAVDIHLLEAPFYLARLPLASPLPFLAHLGGITIFFFYLCLIWQAGRSAYQRIFARRITLRAFFLANLRVNLAMVLPWLLLSASSDLLRLAPLPRLQEFLTSPWGEPLLALMSLVVLVVFLPPIIVRLWGCAPMPASPARQRIESFCAKHDIPFADILLWPLFEGRMLTAGVMGINRRFRYLLVTPALLETMTQDELEAVMAHEIGHVKLYHLPLYLLLFLGFGLLVQMGSVPLLVMLLESDRFNQMILASGKNPDTILAITTTVAVFLLILVYFRFVFGFFMRNFERQADLHALTTIGHADPLVRVFEKIAWLSGNIRDLPCWHHFGIGQRINFLLRCEHEPLLVRQHHRKVWLTLLLYLILLTAAITQAMRMPQDLLKESDKVRLAETLILRKLTEQPNNPLWVQLLGDLRYSLGRQREALTAYQQAIQLAPDNQEALNNLAWLLLTAEEHSLRDPTTALALAERAVALGESAPVLDTLATALWMNGRQEEALAKETAALALATSNKDFYRRQLGHFRSTSPPGRQDAPREEGKP